MGARPVGKESGLQLIERYVSDGNPISLRSAGIESHRNMVDEYVTHLLTLVDVSDIRPLRIVIDAGNGMAGYTAPFVFQRLQAEVIEMYFELDGTFPNHEANPIDPANLRDLQKAVRKHKADIGLAFDGDADRCFLVDENSEIVNPSTLTALISARELMKHPHASVIYNLISSRAVPEIIEENGGTAIRSRVGHSYIKKLMAETEAAFGGEHSGHFYFRDFWCADSGMLAALHAIAALGSQESSLSTILKPYHRYIASGEINSTVSNPQEILTQLEETFTGKDGSTVDHLDGLTVNSAAWWFNVRPSNTEPLLRLNVEAISMAELERVRGEVLAIIRG